MDLILFVTLGLISPAVGQEEAKPSAATRTITALFVCERGKTVRAAFTNGPQSHVTLSLSDGRKLGLPQVIAASGARYANGDESFVFWNKGNTAFIEESGKLTFAGCIAKR